MMLERSHSAGNGGDRYVCAECISPSSSSQKNHITFGLTAETAISIPVAPPHREGPPDEEARP
eukprot:scaffold36388_cov46-Attheya_sp.AAC.3